MSGLITEDKNILVLPIGRPLSPANAFPIDERVMFSSTTAAREAAKSAGEVGNNDSQYYFGMKLCVDDKEKGTVTWYTIQRDGSLLADNHDGSTVTGIIARDFEEGKGQWYTMTYSDGRTVSFCAPIGPKGENGISLVADKQFYIDVDEENNIVLHYVDGGTPPKVDYDPETGHLTLTIDGVKNDIGNVRGEKGEKGEKGDKGDKGEAGADGTDGVVLGVRGHYYLSVDENQNLVVHYQDGDEPPNLKYDAESGKLYLVLDKSGLVRNEIGYIRGEKGDKGDKGEAGTAGKNGNDGITPRIDETTGNWLIGNHNTGVKAKALSIEGHYFLAVDDDQLICYHDSNIEPPNLRLEEDGHLYLYLDESGLARKDLGCVSIQGLTPQIGDNGNWWIGGEDTGKPALGSSDKVDKIIPTGSMTGAYVSRTSGSQALIDVTNGASIEKSKGAVKCGSTLVFRDADGYAYIATPKKDYQICNKKYVDDMVTNLVSSAPSTLDTLKELAAALGDDPNFATTIMSVLGEKADRSEIPNVSNITANTIKQMFVDDTLKFDLSEDGTLYLITED